MATVQDVAKAVGVSTMTVSNVIDDHPHVRPATRERVLAASARLDHRVNVAARSLRKGRTGTIGLAVVLLGERIFGGPVDHVGMPDVEASAADTRHLIERGCRRVAVVCGGAAGRGRRVDCGTAGTGRRRPPPVCPRTRSWHGACPRSHPSGYSTPTLA
ncbi:LacI family DNA-binding transcriptional regulator [Streptomyces sp. NPDC054783]